MESPEQVIAKIRSAPDDESAMKVLKECGYALKPSDDDESEGEEQEGAAGIEIEMRAPKSRREAMDSLFGGGKRGMA